MPVRVRSGLGAPAWIDGLAKPDVVAPGVGMDAKAAEGGKLYTLYPQVLEDSDPNISVKRFAKLSGTSMSAGVASGVVALVLEANGWCKDMDPYTRDGGTLAPLPSSGRDPDRRDRLHARYNTRYESGR